jgi:hypothetical protein
MSTCLNFEDIIEIGKPQLALLETVGDSYPSGDDIAACTAFTKQVRTLEAFLTQTYSVAAVIAKRAPELKEIADIWQDMGGFCDEAMRALLRLKDKYPHCGTPELYDLALDYRIACENRYRGVLEEMQCQKTALPAGLFPATS